MSFIEKRTLRLIVILEARGIGRDELGRRSGLSPEEIDAVIDDGHLPGSEHRKRIAAVLGVSEDYLFGSQEQVEAFLDSDEHWKVVKARFREGGSGRDGGGGNG